MQMISRLLLISLSSSRKTGLTNLSAYYKNTLSGSSNHTSVAVNFLKSVPVYDGHLGAIPQEQEGPFCPGNQFPNAELLPQD